MRLHSFALAALVTAACLTAQPASAEVQVTMHDGVVTIVAKDVTVRQILAEWARVGQTRIVNPDVVTGGPISLQLTNMPEQQALDIILRTASYLAAPRQTAVANASRFDRIVLMPSSSAPPARAAAAPPPPAFPQPRPLPVPDDQDDDVPRNGPPPAPPLAQQVQQAQQLLQQTQQLQQLQQQQQRVTTPSPVFSTFPPPITPQEPGGAVPPPTPFNQSTPGGAPIGTSAPGMILQPPAQNGQPGQQPGRF